jgi:DNA-binding transcriptional MerR regulator
MDASIPDKVYFRIGEVSKILGVAPYVVRYWESEFKVVKPVRTRSAQRLYRRQDVELLLTIKRLLYTDHFTIAGAKIKLADKICTPGKEEGVTEYRKRLLEIKNQLQQVRKMLQ